MSIYSAAQITAKRMLTKFGQTVTHTIRTAGTYDYSTGAVVVTETSQTVKAAVFDFGAEEIDGQIIISGDKRALVPAKGITAPKIGDTLSVGGIVWTVKNVKEVNPAGTSVMFSLQVRK